MKTRTLGVAALVAVAGAALYGLFGVPADLNQGDVLRHLLRDWAKSKGI